MAAIIWPAYHSEPRWKEHGLFADGKGAWQNVCKWTEGQYLEPCAEFGYGFLNATARVVGGSGQASE